jgi:protein kinase-like protein
MESEEPGGFLPAHFPSPAPNLVLSRPGTQHVPFSSNRNFIERAEPDHGHARVDGRRSHANAEGYRSHPLAAGQPRDLNRVYPQPPHPLPAGQPRELNRVYPQPPYTMLPPLYNNPQAVDFSPLYNHPQVDGRSSQAHPEGYNNHRQPAIDRNRVYPQPPYVPTQFYNNPDESFPLYNHIKPAYESTNLYGLFIQPESRTRNKYADGTHTAGRHGQLPLPESHIASSSGIASTPILYRMSAKRPPGDQSFISAPQLESCLNKDLHGNIIVTLPTFFLDDLWPASNLPCPLNEKIFNMLALNEAWDNIHDCFVTPPSSITEHCMAEWLNKLGGLIGVYTGSSLERKRSWSAITHTRSPDGASINRKPDLILVDRLFVDKPPDSTPSPHISWTHIHAFAEVTRSYPFPKRITTTINDKSYLLFISQHDRRFVPALSFNGLGLFALTLTDRQGQISTPPMPFLHGKANAFMFMKILTFLMYGPVHNAGRDTTMELQPSGHVKSISVNRHWYTVVYLIYSLQSMIGRGTTVWLVSRNGRYYILKDSWIQNSRVESEIAFLQKLKDDPMLKNRVPDLIEGEDICVGGAVDSTGRYREHIGGMHDSRGHRRLVMTPIGKQITTFESKSEFINAIIDVIEGK